ncbi:MAG: hypothetical protein AB1757_09235 [Acidobacteriota bacterium]
MMSVTKQDQLFFFLGGRDLEMLTIRELLERHAPFAFCDKNLVWGAKASDYKEEIEKAIIQGKTPVFIELTVDLDLADEQIITIDHHGKRAGSDKPTSLHQVFELLNLPSEQWTRWHDLVAANDRGHIKAMKEIGATQEEIKQVRAADRRAQGVTEEEEQKAEEAVRNARVLLDGKLTAVNLPHSRTSPITDRLEKDLSGTGYENLLVISPDQVNFFGTGQIIQALNKQFQGGWYGGSLPEWGFWGGYFVGEEVLKFLCEFLEEVVNTK